MYTWKLNNLSLNPPGAVLSDFISGNFRVLGAESVPITNANNSTSTIETGKFQLRVVIKDDDELVQTLLPHSPLLQDLVTIYQSVYLQIIDLGPMSSAAPQFDPNLGDDLADFGEVASCNETIGFENPSFWCAHIISTWQGSSIKDFDGHQLTGDTHCPPLQTSPFGLELNPLLGYTHPINLNDNQLASGGDHSYTFMEVLDELSLNDALTIAHEVGHQFGLSHGNENQGPPIPECCGANMGLMAANGFFSFLIPRHKNLIRSRTQSPGGH